MDTYSETYLDDIHELKKHIGRIGIRGEWTQQSIVPIDVSRVVLSKDKVECHTFETFHSIKATVLFHTATNQVTIQGDPAFKEIFYRTSLRYEDPMANLDADDLPDRIAENLYLGGHEAALNIDGLKERKITHIITAGKGLKMPYPDHFKYKFIDILDWEQENIMQYFASSIEFIEEGRLEGAVLIHCAAGVSRSATITIAYLMQCCGYGYAEARKFVQTKRWIHPNLGFAHQLIKFENQLEVRRKEQKKLKKQLREQQAKEMNISNEMEALKVIDS